MRPARTPAPQAKPQPLPPQTRRGSFRDSAQVRRCRLRRCAENPYGRGRRSRYATSGLDRRLDARVTAAAADVRHPNIDVVIGGVRFARDERGRRHDLARLAVTALRYVLRDPCDLHGMRLVDGREAFDRRDLLAHGVFHRKNARSHGRAVDVHGARAARGDAAAELRARQTNNVANGPQQGHLVGNVEDVFSTVYRQLYHSARNSRARQPQPSAAAETGSFLRRYIQPCLTILTVFVAGAVRGVLPAGYLFCCRMYASTESTSSGLRLPGFVNGIWVA